MWATLWARIQGWAAMAGAVVAVLVGAYALGSRNAHRAEAAHRAARALKARRARDDAVAQVDSMDDAAVRDAARRRMRNSR